MNTVTTEKILDTQNGAETSSLLSYGHLGVICNASVARSSQHYGLLRSWDDRRQGIYYTVAADGTKTVLNDPWSRGSLVIPWASLKDLWVRNEYIATENMHVEFTAKGRVIDVSGVLATRYVIMDARRWMVEGGIGLVPTKFTESPDPTPASYGLISIAGGQSIAPIQAAVNLFIATNVNIADFSATVNVVPPTSVFSPYFRSGENALSALIRYLTARSDISFAPIGGYAIYAAADTTSTPAPMSMSIPVTGMEENRLYSGQYDPGLSVEELASLSVPNTEGATPYVNL